MRHVKIDDLNTRLIRFLKGYFSDIAAERIAEVIIWTERRNKGSQGLLKLLGSQPLQNVIPLADVVIIDKTPVSSIIQGNKQPSFYVAQLATDLAIEKASRNGFSVIGVNGIFSSTGALGYYAERMANSDLIGLVMARSPGATAPFETKTPLFGTNPIAVGFPARDQPIIFDMATSAMTWYELILAKMRGEALPENAAIDSTGKRTTSAIEALKGALLPFDQSHKGSGLAMMVELMSGPLVGSAYCDYQSFDKDWGFFILCFKPDLLVDLEEFKRHAGELRAIVKSQPHLDGKSAIRFPGEAGNTAAATSFECNTVEIEDDIAILLGFPAR